MGCLNGDGTEKLPLTFIEKSKIPKYFNRQTSTELGFGHCLNSKPWGNFFEWLEEFDSYIGEQEIEKLFYSLTILHAVKHWKIYPIF